jgi:hypothetical protein
MRLLILGAAASVRLLRLSPLAVRFSPTSSSPITTWLALSVR